MDWHTSSLCLSKRPCRPQIIPDEETAPIVKYIFPLCAGAKGHTQIAKQLKAEQIPTPYHFYFLKYGVVLTNYDPANKYESTQRHVVTILEDEVYLGHTISLKTTTISYKNKKKIERPKSEQLRFENTHEALVDQTTWEIV